MLETQWKKSYVCVYFIVVAFPEIGGSSAI